MPAIKVSTGGEYTHYHTAERCVVTIRVSKEGESQAEVVEVVTSLSNELSLLFRSLCPKDDEDKSKGVDINDESIPITHWSMSSLSTSSYIPYNNDSTKKKPAPKRQYRASTSFSIKFKDFRKMGQVCLDVTKRDEISVGNLDWRLTDATRQNLATTVRQGAVRNAVEKAHDYVSIFSPNTTSAADNQDKQSKWTLTAEEIKDEAATSVMGYGSAPGRHGAKLMRASAFGGGGNDEETLDFEPEDVSLSASVLCTFSMQLSG